MTVKADSLVDNITAKPTGDALGAVVSGIDLSQNLSDEQVQELKDLLARYKVLVFRDQSMTSEQQLSLGRRFGTLEVHPFTPVKGAASALGFDPDQLELVIVESLPGKPTVAEHWHSDTSWRDCPSMGSILRMTIKPESGGNTMWADMAAAFEALDDKTKNRIENATAIHNWQAFERGMLAKGASEETMTTLRKQFPAVEHPVVVTHPETGDRILFVNPVFTVKILGMSTDESDQLLAHLYQQIAKPEFHMTLSWEERTVVFWDNRSTQHMVSGDVIGHRRLERVTIVGQRPN